MRPENYFLNCHTEKSVSIRFKKLSNELHPDKHPQDPGATKKFQEMKDQRDAALRYIYKKTGISDKEIEEKLHAFVMDLDNLDFSKINDVSEMFAKKFMEEHPDEDPTFANMAKFVLGNLFGAEKKKNKKIGGQGAGPGKELDK